MKKLFLQTYGCSLDSLCGHFVASSSLGINHKFAARKMIG